MKNLIKRNNLNVIRLNRLDPTKLTGKALNMCGFLPAYITPSKVDTVKVLDFLSKVIKDKVVKRPVENHPEKVYGEVYFTNPDLWKTHEFSRANIKYSINTKPSRNGKSFKHEFYIIDKKLGDYVNFSINTSSLEVSRIYIKYIVSVVVYQLVELKLKTSKRKSTTKKMTNTRKKLPSKKSK